MDNKFDLIIMGAGPAGMSAAVYAVRSGINSLVIGTEGTASAAEKATAIENYFGIDSISGSELINAGRKQLERLGAKTTNEEIVGISWDGVFHITTATSAYKAKAVIFATGNAAKQPKVPGIDSFEQKGISYCAVCDAFFYRGKAVGVLGSGEYALHEVQMLKEVVANVTLLTNGEEPSVDFPKDVRIERSLIKSMYSEGQHSDLLGGVELDNSTRIPLSGIFVAVGQAASSDLARKLGILLDDKGKIIVDMNMQTNLPGSFAAGDCVTGEQQISIAVGEGAKAALSAIKFLKKS